MNSASDYLRRSRLLCILALVLWAARPSVGQVKLPALHPQCGVKEAGPAVCQGKKYVVIFPDVSTRISSSGDTHYYLDLSTESSEMVVVSVVQLPFGPTVAREAVSRRGSGAGPTPDLMFATVRVPLDIKLTGSTVRQQKALLVEATGGDISLYASVQRGGSRYSYWVIPTSGLGTEYFAITLSASNPENNWKAVIAIVSVEPGVTQLDVQFPRLQSSSTLSLIAQLDLSQYTNGERMQRVLLNQYDALQVQAVQGDLTGTSIRADKKIVVISGNDEANINERVGTGQLAQADAMFEQLPPLDSWGMDFYTLSARSINAGNNLPKFFMKKRIVIVAGWLNTDVYVNKRKTSLKRRGESFSLDYTATNRIFGIRIRATKPILVAEFIGSDREGPGTRSLFAGRRKRQANRQIWQVNNPKPSMVLLPAVEQYSDVYDFDAKRDDYDQAWLYSYVLYVSIETSLRRGIVLDGRNIGRQFNWHEVPGSRYSVGFYEGTFQVPFVGYHRLRHNGGAKFGAWLFAAQTNSTASYAVNLGLSLSRKTCKTCALSQCDVKDNDCDYGEDEEICDGKDNDNDGRIDEDCCGYFLIDIPVTQNVFVGLVSGGAALFLALLTAAGITLAQNSNSGSQSG